MSKFFGDKFELESAIGSGSFGQIYFTRNIKTGEALASKVEKVGKRRVKSQLRREAKIYRMLNDSVGIPKVKWFGEYPDKFVLVMDLLGDSLEDLFNYCNRKFSLKTVLLLAYELISRIETIHTDGKLIHRDIKPENFLIGRNRDRHTVYLIDFGLSKHYCNPATNRHIPCKEGHSLTGTARYASVNSHRGIEQSRRDDLISIGYVLLYFLRGSLPWQGLKTQAQLREEALERGESLPIPDLAQDNAHTETEEQEKYRIIMEKKQSTPVAELCAGFPEEFVKYFEHLETLSFADTPDYAHLKALFRDLFRKKGFGYDSILYDWEIKAHQLHQLEQQHLQSSR